MKGPNAAIVGYAPKLKAASFTHLARNACRPSRGVQSIHKLARGRRLATPRKRIFVPTVLLPLVMQLAVRSAGSIEELVQIWR